MIAAAAGCSSLPRNPVPSDAIDSAVIAGMPGIRAWAGEYSEDFHRDAVQSVRDEHAEDYCNADGNCDFAALALSGGGFHGAFGAGFLKGWTEAGTRPTFKLVTGISTGALMAPYAFLGPEYDDELERLYTSVRAKDVYKKRNVFGLIRAESLAKTTPLAILIDQGVSDELIRKVAEAHARGRRLLVGTTNLDAQRLVIWNMGAIAATDRPGARELFRDVLLASASIPVAFPPVLVEVEVNGAPYDEMHADGGVVAEFFLFNHIIDIETAREQLGIDTDKRRGSVYIIRNGQMEPVPEQVRRRITAIAERSLDTLLVSVAMSDLFQIWKLAQEAGFDFHYVAIPEEIDVGNVADFDSDTIRRLFDLGYKMAQGEHPWQTKPPWTKR